MRNFKRAAQAVTVAALGVSLMGMAMLPSCGEFLKKKQSEGEPLFSSSSKKMSDEEVLEEAFAALRANDWERFKKVSVTDADMVVKRRGYNQFNVGQSFEGGVLLPEQWQQKREAFNMAVAGGENAIDFGSAKYLGPGTLVSTDSWESLDRVVTTARVYSLRLSINGEEIDTQDRSPLFYLVDFNGRPYLLQLAARMDQAPSEPTPSGMEEAEYEADDDDRYDDRRDDSDDDNPYYEPPQEEEEPDYGGYFDDNE